MKSPNLFFSTPVWASKVENYKDTNELLYNYIMSLKNIDTKGIVKSNIKGWHSKDFDMKEEVPKKFIQLITSHINDVLVSMNWDLDKQKVKISNMWAIINKGGAANSRHHHGNSTLSAAYYVRAPNQSGDIVFYDPRPAPIYYHPIAKGPNSLNAMVNSISPSEGGLIIFPSYLDHSVNENMSSEERIVISFNISLINN